MTTEIWRANVTDQTVTVEPVPESWQRLGGANFGWPHRVLFDPHDETQLYLTTFGGSVWHGPKRGTTGLGPDIVEIPPVTAVRP